MADETERDEPEPAVDAETAAGGTEPEAGTDPGGTAPEGSGTERDAGPGDGEPAGATSRWPMQTGVLVALVIGVVVALVVASGGFGGDDGGGDSDGGRSATTTTEAEASDGTAGAPTSAPPGNGGAAGAAFLSDLEPLEDDGWQPAGDGVTIGGQAYAHTLASDPIGGCDEGASSRTISFALDRRYTRLSGTVGLADSSEPGRGTEIAIEADGVEIYWRSFVQGATGNIQVDVSGAARLTITAAPVFVGDSCVTAALGDLGLS